MNFRKMVRLAKVLRTLKLHSLLTPPGKPEIVLFVPVLRIFLPTYKFSYQLELNQNYP
jgi:hypothetical protein